MRRWLPLLLLFPLLTAGCGVFVQTQYGWANKDRVRIEDTVVETITKLGAPDFQTSSKDEKLMSWKHVERISVCGVFEQIKRGELILLARDDQVNSVQYIPRGESMAILGLVALHTDEED